MKPITFVLLLACFQCIGQTADDSTPATSNVLGSQYPRIHQDLSATFRLKAPDAQKVDVNVGGATYEMKKDAEGYWSATSAPLVPGFHYYALHVDGVAINDPGSETYYGVSREYSGIEIPESGVDFYSPKNVPHGEMRERPDRSNITEPWRRCFVYTPPGYDEGKMRYPVLYCSMAAEKMSADG